MSLIQKAFEQWGIPWTQDKEDLLLSYMDGILEKNRQVNLTAITDREEFMSKHLIDSLSCGSIPGFRQAETVIDVGTGGGFPGVPLAIAFPEKSFVLVDSLAKRIRIISDLCRQLGIGNAEAIHGRAEELGRREDLREHFDVCVSRAVANLRSLSEYCLPFVRVGGIFIAYKGPSGEEECREAAGAIRTLGGEWRETFRPASGGEISEHQLLVIEKSHKTGERYPRRAGVPSKKPL